MVTIANPSLRAQLITRRTYNRPLDEEGKEVPTVKGLLASLRDRDEIKLYDQGAWNSDDNVTIEQAYAPA